MHDPDTHPDPTASPGPGTDGPADEPTANRYAVDEDEPLDVAITYAIAAADDVDPRDVEPPLHDIVDGEALERVFESSAGDARARFTLGSYDVRIEDGGDLVVVAPA